jgi:hypothetical protein
MTAILILLGLTGILIIAGFFPSWAVILWLFAVLMVPAWEYIWTPIGFFPFVGILAAPVVAVLSLSRRNVLSVPHWAVLAFTGTSILGTTLGGLPGYYVRDAIFMWLFPFVLGQTAVNHLGIEWVERMLGRLAVLLAVLAITEFMLSWHPFVHVVGPVASVNFWSALQTRGNFTRSEWSFGHAIALGGSLVLLAPFVVRAYPRKFRLASFGLVAAVLTTVSRGALLALGISWAFDMLHHGLTRKRTQQAALLIVAAACTAVFLSGVLHEANVEVEASTQFRKNLVSQLIYKAQIATASSAISSGAFGRESYGGFTSVDNQFLLSALDSGWISAFALLAIFFRPFRNVVLRRRGSPAEIALLAMAPLLWTVALITQWAALLFFVAGVAYSRPKNLEGSGGSTVNSEPANTRSHVQIMYK